MERQPPTVQIGVVSFSDSGLSVQAPTNDQAAVLAAINRLAPARGTSLANGILASLNAIAAGRAGSRRASTATCTPDADADADAGAEGDAHRPPSIVLLTDGENTEPPDPTRGGAAGRRSRRAHLHRRHRQRGGGDAARSTASPSTRSSTRTTLKQIAQMTGGAYYNAENEQDLRAIYENLDPQLVIKPEKTEVTSLFAGAGSSSC